MTNSSNIFWTSQGGKRSGSSTPRPAKRINVHGDGKPNQNRNGGQGNGSTGAK